ncbi:predicted protein [Sclerotinia sclerotiorum 1980 UF-70]|uniref:Uncharacterized protein n=1 Tax=Sclerotinia sclerotiorum (strain ATCC 18683 / 1980 / Ss-1) TaxID=665079 RepID=A7EKE3_SCLS1|nr:predicted protein [Sclerotinia sclerotiorum 1980 UF-70]EDO03309.1 predicted protein [Sclerotinia sclerotiorum 1980 UF-70]
MGDRADKVNQNVGSGKGAGSWAQSVENLSYQTVISGARLTSGMFHSPNYLEHVILGVGAKVGVEAYEMELHGGGGKITAMYLV